MCQVCNSQTNWFRSFSVTNWVNVPSSYRIFNGKLYDTRHSAYWAEVSDFISHLKVGGVYANLKVVTIGKNFIVCDAYSNDKGIRPTGFPALDQTLSGAFIKRVVIYNYPQQDQLESGQLLISCIATRVHNLKLDGESIEAYDCGLPCTNKIPVVKIVKMKLVSTNSP